MARRHAALPMLLLLCLVLAACGGTGSSSAEPSIASEAPSIPPSDTPSLEPSTVQSAAPSPSETASEPRQFGMNVPVTLTVPNSWSREDFSTQAQLILHIVADRWMVFSTLGPDTVDEWVTNITTQPQLTVVSEPQPTEVGGASGYTVDVTTNEETGVCRGVDASQNCYTLFEDEGGPWLVFEGTTTRAWVVDVDGETVIIVADAPTSGFEAWMQQMEDVLATAEWGS